MNFVISFVLCDIYCLKANFEKVTISFLLDANTALRKSSVTSKVTSPV